LRRFYQTACIAGVLQKTFGAITSILFIEIFILNMKMLTTMLMHRSKKKKLKNDDFFVTKTAMDIQDNVYLTPADNTDDLIQKIVAVSEQIPPEFLLNAAMGVSGRWIFGNSIFFY
jgi:hypothetical protein